MKTIWKYPLENASEQELLIPVGAETLTVQVQHGKPCLWVLCDPHRARDKYTIEIYVTGGDVPERVSNRHYIGTYQLDGGSLIYHVFIKP